MNDEVSTVTLRYVVDQASVDQVIDSAETLEQTVNRLETFLNSTGASGQEAFDNIQRSFAEGGTNIQALNDYLGVTQDYLSKVNVQVSDLEESFSSDPFSQFGGKGVSDTGDSSVSLGNSGAGASATLLRNAGQLAGRNNAVGSSLVGAAELDRVGLSLLKLQEILPTVSDSLEKIPGLFGDLASAGSKTAVALGATSGGTAEAMGTMLAVAAPFAAALAVGTVAFIAFETELSASKTLLDEAVKSVDDYYKAIASGTTSTIQVQLDKAQQDQDAQRQKLATLQAGEGIGGPLDPLKNALANIIDPSVVKDVQATEKAIKDDQAAIDGLTRAMGSNTVAANDATAAQDAQAKQDVSDLNKQAQLYAQDQQMKTQSVASIQKVINADSSKIDINNQELIRLHDLANASVAGSSAQKTYQSEIQKVITSNLDLNAQIVDLQKNILPVVQGTDSLKTGIKDLGTVTSDTAKQVRDITTAFGAVDDAATKYSDTVQATNAARQLSDSRAQQDYDNNRLKEISGFQQAQLNKDANFAQSQADGYAKLYASTSNVISNEQATALKDQAAFAQTWRDNALKLNEQIQQIQEQANATELDAAYKLDAHGVENAKRQAAQQIDKLTTNYNDSKSIADRNEQQKLDDMLVQATKQRDQSLANGLVQLQDQKQKYDDQRAQAQQAENIKLSDQKATFDLAKQRRDEDRIISDAARDKAYKDKHDSLVKHYNDLLTAQTLGQKNLTDSFNSFWTNLTANAKANAPAVTTSTNGGGGQPGTYSSGGGGNLPGGISTVLGSSYIQQASPTKSIGQAFTDGLQSAVKTAFNFLGAFDNGTGLAGAKDTGFAHVRKGEIILDGRSSDALRDGRSGSPSTSIGNVNVTQHFHLTGSDITAEKLKPIVKQATTEIFQDLAR